MRGVRGGERIVLRILAILPLCWSFGLANRLLGYLRKKPRYEEEGRGEGRREREE